MLCLRCTLIHPTTTNIHAQTHKGLFRHKDAHPSCAWPSTSSFERWTHDGILWNRKKEKKKMTPFGKQMNKLDNQEGNQQQSSTTLPNWTNNKKSISRVTKRESSNEERNQQRKFKWRKEPTEKVQIKIGTNRKSFNEERNQQRNEEPLYVCKILPILHNPCFATSESTRQKPIKPQ